MLLIGSIGITTPRAFGDFQVPVPSECSPTTGTSTSDSHTLTANQVGSSVSGSATITNPVVSQVRFVLDPGVGSSQQLDTSAPFTYSFTGLSPGSHTIVACYELPGIVGFLTLHTQARTVTSTTPLPDLLCYVVEGVVGTVINPNPVVVQDQFGTETVDPAPSIDPIAAPSRFCGPVLKNPGEETVPVSPHFVVYNAIGTIDPPTVTLTDQFGPEDVNPGTALWLWTGALKFFHPTTEVPLPAIHFKEYPIASKIDPPPVLLKDQFGSFTVDPGPAVSILVPTVKNGIGSLNLPHYRCYPTSHATEIGQVPVSDQFGDQILVFNKAVLFCDAGEKTVTPPPTVPVGGEILPIDMTALFITGAMTNAFWVLPTLGGIAGAAMVLFKIKRKHS